MMRETLRFLASPVRGLQAAVYVLAASALLSSVLALVRDRLFAHTFGAGTELDIYYAAFRIPDLLFVTTGALVSVYILIPQLVRRSPEEQKTYIDTIILGFSGLAVALSAIAALFAPYFLAALFPNFAAASLLPTLVTLTRIMLLQPILLGLSNILAAITQARQRYTLYALSPILYNIGIILGLIVLYPLFGMSGLAWGVTLGAAMHFGIQIPSIRNDGFFANIPTFREGRALIETMMVSVPRAMALSMNQLTILGLTVFASGLAAGSIAVFTFAFNLMSVPLSVIGASYSVAAFPTLASALSNGRRDEFLEYVTTAARYILFWSLPVVGLIIVLRAHVVRIVLGSGSFDWTDTRLTAAVFALLSIALAAHALTLLLTRAYYAAGRTFIPFFIATISAFATIVMAFVFLRMFEDPFILQTVQAVMRLEEVPGVSVLALALAYALVSIGTVISLTIMFELKFNGFVARVWVSLAHGLCAALAGLLAAYGMLALIGPLTLTSTFLSVFTRGAAAAVVGILGAGIVYALLNNREFWETVTSLRGKLWRDVSAQPLRSAEDIGSSST